MHGFKNIIDHSIESDHGTFNAIHRPNVYISLQDEVSPLGKLLGKQYVAQLALSIGFPGPILPVPEVKILEVQTIHLMRC